MRGRRTERLRNTVSVALIVQVLLVCATASASQQTVGQLAVKRFAAKQFAAAASAFAAAFAVEADPANLFAWAQAERLAGHCDRAIPLYSLYLSTRPDRLNRDAATKSVALCDGSVIRELTDPGLVSQPIGRKKLSELFRTGYATHKDPWFLYAEVTTLNPPGDCERIRWIERSVGPRAHAALRSLLADASAPCTRVRSAVVARAHRSDRGRRGVRALVVTSAALVGVGAVILTVGTTRVSGGGGATYAEFVDRVNTGRRLQWIGGVTLGAGAIVVTLAIHRILANRTSPVISPITGEGRVGVGAQWSY